MNAAQEIKERLTMPDLYEKYGFTPNRGGFIMCPFHREDTPSLRAYQGGTTWHCFGCNAGGSVIDFVMRLFSLSFRQAVVRLDNDFDLHLTSGPPDARKTAQISREIRLCRQAEEREEANYQALWSRYALLDQFLAQNTPTEKTAGDFGAWMGEKEMLWWRIQRINDKRDGR